MVWTCLKERDVEYGGKRHLDQLKRLERDLRMMTGLKKKKRSEEDALPVSLLLQL